MILPNKRLLIGLAFTGAAVVMVLAGLWVAAVLYSVAAVCFNLCSCVNVRKAPPDPLNYTPDVGFTGLLKTVPVSWANMWCVTATPGRVKDGTELVLDADWDVVAGLELEIFEGTRYHGPDRLEGWGMCQQCHKSLRSETSVYCVFCASANSLAAHRTPLSPYDQLQETCTSCGGATNRYDRTHSQRFRGMCAACWGEGFAPRSGTEIKQSSGSSGVVWAQNIEPGQAAAIAYLEGGFNTSLNITRATACMQHGSTSCAACCTCETCLTHVPSS